MTSELVNAWSAYDRWAAGAKKRRAFTGKEGKAEAARLVSALVAEADRLDISHTELRDRIAAGRREGLSIEQAVGRAVS